MSKTSKLLLAASRRVVAAGGAVSLPDLRAKIGDDELYSLVHNLYMSDALRFNQIRVTQTSPQYVISMEFRPSSDAGQDDGGLNEDAIADLGYFVDKGRRNMSDFWTSLSAEGGTFTLTVGARP